MAEKTVAFIVARHGSSRLPGKHFRSIGDRSMIQWIIDQLKLCIEIDEIVIATVAEPGNEPLRHLASEENLSCFWYEGEIEQVTTRLCAAAQHYQADICLLISGDCPLVYGVAIDHLLKSFKGDKLAEVLQVDQRRDQHPPALPGVEIARHNAWLRAEEMSDSPELKEHHFPIIGLKKALFRIHHCYLPSKLYGPLRRLSVDTLADLEFLNKVYQKLEKQNKPFQLPYVLNLLNEQPDLLTINSHVHQRGLKEDIKNILFIIDTGGEFGYGHLMRSLELASQIVERMGWPVSFLVDDVFSKELLESHGLTVIRGSLQRGTSSKNHTDFQDGEFDRFDMAILDLAERPVRSGWRKGRLIDIPVLVLDKTSMWTQESDLIIVPGVTVSPEQVKKLQNVHKQPKVLWGKEYIIIRRQIREAMKYSPYKKYDLLLYVHDNDLQERLLEQAVECQLSVVAVDGKDPDFPRLLAQSRYYLGEFGYGFYEALALSVTPIAISSQKIIAEDTRLFYKEFDLPAHIFDITADLKGQFCCLNKNGSLVSETVVGDDCSQLIGEIKGCLDNHILKGKH